jgi:hypothetical protein
MSTRSQTKAYPPAVANASTRRRKSKTSSANTVVGKGIAAQEKSSGTENSQNSQTDQAVVVDLSAPPTKRVKKQASMLIQPTPSEKPAKSQPSSSLKKQSKPSLKADVENPDSIDDIDDLPCKEVSERKQEEDFHSEQEVGVLSQQKIQKNFLNPFSLFYLV